MAINYDIPVEYQFDYYYNAADIVLAAGSSMSLTALNFNPQALSDWARKGEAVNIPEGPGAHFLTDGFPDAVEMEFTGAAEGLTPHDTFDYMCRRTGRMMSGGDFKYIRAGLHDGTQKIYFRRYGQPINGGGTYARKTRFTTLADKSFLFLATDPAWYRDTVTADSISVSSGTSGNKAVSDTGDFRSQRVLIYITRTGATPTNVTIKNSANHTLGITGTLATNGDYWLIDMINGTVKKSVSSVISNDIANVTGRFWGIAPGSDTITFTSTVSCSVTVSIFWLPKMT